MIEYFDSGLRLSMFELALLLAAARGKRVFLWGKQTQFFERKDGETDVSFPERLVGSTSSDTGVALPGSSSTGVFAALYKGDIDLPKGSVCYALFPERMANTIAASDLIS